MKKALVVEDDPVISYGLKTALEGEQFQVTVCDNGESGFKSALEINPDIIILDVMLPVMTGFDVCRNIRSRSIKSPIIMLTAKSDEIDKVVGLEIGADDYVTKPFSIRELIARINALLRRTIFSDNKQSLDIVEFGSVKIDFQRLECTKAGKRLELSAKEFQIIKFFNDNENKVVTRDMLLDTVWGYEKFPTTRTVDNYILHIRKVIEDEPSEPKHLITVHTLGYKFLKNPL